MLLDSYNQDQYQITQNFLPPSCYGPAYPVTPKLFIVHSTGTTEQGLRTDTVERERAIFSDPNFQASATFAVDAGSITQLVPLDQMAWHACRIPNRIAWGVEMCETTDKAAAMEVIRRTIWLATKMVLDHNVAVASHHELSQIWPKNQFQDGTDHVDPDGWLQSVGYSWTEFTANVVALTANARQPAGQAVSVQLPDGRSIEGVLSGGTTWVQIGGIWCPLRAWAETLGFKVGWRPPEQGGPHVTIAR